MFQFKHFALHHEQSSLKIGTDSVLLASYVPVAGIRTVLDIGCGCGVIGFCIADRIQQQHTDNYVLTGIDIDGASIAECHRNAALFPKTENAIFHFEEISLQDFTKLHQSEYQLIVCNPPYFGNSLKPEDEKRLQSRHRDDTLPFETLAECVSNLLADDGLFYLILPYSEAIEFEQIASRRLHLCEKMEIRPVPDKTVNRCILGFGRHPAVNLKRTTLTIRDDRRDYTPEYLELTHDFYLDF